MEPFEALFLSGVVMLVLAYLSVLTFLTQRYAATSQTEDALETESTAQAFDSLENAPTKEELQSLKQQLNLTQGTLTFKSGSVYHIIYQNRKHTWNCLGSWPVLKEQLEA